MPQPHDPHTESPDLRDLFPPPDIFVAINGEAESIGPSLVEAMPIPPSEGRPYADLLLVPEGQWSQAKRKAEAVERLVSGPPTKDWRMAVCAEFQVHQTTLYRWTRQYMARGRNVSAFLNVRTRKGVTKITVQREAIIQKVVLEHFLKEERPPVTHSWRLLERLCEKGNLLPAPSLNTLRNRITAVDLCDRVKARMGPAEARKTLRPRLKTYDEALWPHSIVEIDHTPLNIIIVDQETREPIGRPILTLVLDVYSRCVLGFYLSLDPPSALSVGLAIMRAVLPKKPWLDELGVDIPWACEGLLECVYTDNGKDFHSRALEVGCEAYRMDLQYRPIKMPEYGGHVERVLGTISKEVNALPGTTRSNVLDKKDYDSVGRACMSLREVEAWLANFIAGYYHHTPHDGLGGQTPMEQYLSESSVERNGMVLPKPALPDDEWHFRLAFLPFEERTVQPYGIQMFGLFYFHDVLRRYIHATTSPDSGNKKFFRLRFDPRDLSFIYFLDEISDQYIPIPFRDTGQRPISLWEQRKRLAESPSKRRKNRPPSNQARQGLDQMDSIQEEAKQKTLSGRRANARKKSHRSNNIHSLRPGAGAAVESSEASSMALPQPISDFPEDLTPFEID